MPTLDTFLRRMRIQGVPGGPGPAGVPVDRRSEVALELGPVLDLLDEAEGRAEALVGAARAVAEQRRARAGEEAAALITSARDRAAAERARATAGALDRADRDCRAVLDAARAESARVESVAAARVPAVAERVVAAVLATGQAGR